MTTLSLSPAQNHLSEHDRSSGLPQIFISKFQCHSRRDYDNGVLRFMPQTAPLLDSSGSEPMKVNWLSTLIHSAWPLTWAGGWRKLLR